MSTNDARQQRRQNVNVMLLIMSLIHIDDNSYNDKSYLPINAHGD